MYMSPLNQLTQQDSNYYHEGYNTNCFVQGYLLSDEKIEDDVDISAENIVSAICDSLLKAQQVLLVKKLFKKGVWREYKPFLGWDNPNSNPLIDFRKMTEIMVNAPANLKSSPIAQFKPNKIIMGSNVKSTLINNPNAGLNIFNKINEELFVHNAIELLPEEKRTTGQNFKLLSENSLLLCYTPNSIYHELGSPNSSNFYLATHE